MKAWLYGIDDKWVGNVELALGEYPKMLSITKARAGAHEVRWFYLSQSGTYEELAQADVLLLDDSQVTWNQ